MIRIELRQPARVQGTIARPQSLALLVLIWLRQTELSSSPQLQDKSQSQVAGRQIKSQRVHRTGDAHRPQTALAEVAQYPKGGLVTAMELGCLFPDATHLRMIISRAFVDFSVWGIEVGWGDDQSVSCALLNTRNRNRGPFWLTQRAFETLQIFCNGKIAAQSDVYAFLKLPPAPVQARLEIAKSDPATANFWREFAIAKREQLDGHLIIDAQRGALAGFRRAQSLSRAPELQAFALLQQAMVWRRAGNPEAATKDLKSLRVLLTQLSAPHWLEALASVVQAWCAYANRDLIRAERILLAAEQNETLAPFFAHHPRVQSERANLHALFQRARALDESLDFALRKQSARAAIEYYQSALAFSCEAELFDTAMSVASNLGWSIWLFARCQLSEVQASAAHDGQINRSTTNNTLAGETEAQIEALRWIALAEVLNAQHGSGINFWNQIYLLRIVRNGGSNRVKPKLLQFQKWPIINGKDYAQLSAQPALRSWLSVVRNLYAQIEKGLLQVDALQRANLLLELAWYEAHQGDLSASRIAVNHLTKRLPELVQSDREFFRQAIRCLPGK